MTVIHRYDIADDKETMTYTVQRSTRSTGRPVKYLLKRDGVKEAYVIRLEDNWQVQGKLGIQAFYISLQGLAKHRCSRLYLLYPENWEFTYVNSVFGFYKTKRIFTFTELPLASSRPSALKQFVNSYVVWDKNVRTSLIVAYTVAGLERSVVVSEDMIPMVEAAGLKPWQTSGGSSLDNLTLRSTHGPTMSMVGAAARIHHLAWR